MVGAVRLGVIYLVRNRVTGKLYVGQTQKTVRKRLAAHRAENRHLLGMAIRKYGINSFEVAIIDDGCSIEELNAREIKWIAHYRSQRPSGYNITAGGDGHLGVRHSDETKRKISRAKKGVFPSTEIKARMSESRRGAGNSFYGRTHSEETKGILSKKCGLTGEANRFFGKKHSAETRTKIRAARAKQVITQEARDKMSKSRKGKKFNLTEEQRARKSEAMKKVDRTYLRGRTLSEETKRKIGESKLGRKKVNGRMVAPELG